MKQRVVSFNSIPSTNTWAKDNIQSFDLNEITILTAKQQTAGRGSKGRTWISPDNVGLYVSYCFFVPTIATFDTSVLLFSVMEIVQKLINNFGLESTIKFPNDVLINGEKISGILCEAIQTESNTFHIVGIGININTEQEIFTNNNLNGTSLSIHTKKNHNIEEILDLLSVKITNMIEVMLTNSNTLN